MRQLQNCIVPMTFNPMKKYLSFFTLRFSTSLQYRAAAWAGVVTQFFWGFMLIATFQAFYKSSPEAFPMTLEATSNYIWLQQAFLAFFSTWMMENEIFDVISNGNLAYELCRPIHVYDMWFARSVATRMSRAVLRCFPILLIAAFLPKPYGLTLPKSFVHFVLFVFTLFLGLAFTVAFCMLIYVLTFFTISPQGIRILFTCIVDFFAGALIPLPFFPDKLRKVMELLPFASMQNVPLRIYSGDYGTGEMICVIVIQVVWFLILVIFGRSLCAYAEKKATIQGG